MTEPKNAAASSGVSAVRLEAILDRFAHACHERGAAIQRQDTDRAGQWLTVIDQCRADFASAAPAAGGLEFDRDTDGELLIDWSPAKGRMLTVSLRDDGRLSYAITWDGEKAHGTAQMPAPERIDADKLHGEIRNLAAHGGMYLRERQYGFAETAFDKIIESIDAHRDARHAAAELVSLCATSKDGVHSARGGGR